MKIQDYIQNVKAAIDSLKEYAISGDIQPFEALAEIKQSALEEDLKINIKDIQSVAVSELQNNFLEHGEKSYKDSSYQYTIRSGTTRYYFTEIQEFKDQEKKVKSSEETKKLNEIKAKYKAAFIQKQKGLAMFDEQTGEEIDVSKVNVVYSADSVTVKPL